MLHNQSVTNFPVGQLLPNWEISRNLLPNWEIFPIWATFQLLPNWATFLLGKVGNLFQKKTSGTKISEESNAHLLEFVFKTPNQFATMLLLSF